MSYVRLCSLLVIATIAACIFAPAVADEKAAEAKPDDKKRVAIHGVVIDADSQPVAGVEVMGKTYRDTTRAVTNERGEFTLDVDSARVKSLSIIADDVAGDRMGTFKADHYNPPNADTPIEISLGPVRRIPVVVVGADDEPAAGSTVGAVIDYDVLAATETDDQGRGELRLPDDCNLQSLYATGANEGFDYRTVVDPRDPTFKPVWFEKLPVRFTLAESETVRIRLTNNKGEPIAGEEVYTWYLLKPGEPHEFNLGYTPELFRARSDEKGLVTIEGVPNWRVQALPLWTNSDDFARQRIAYDYEQQVDGPLVLVLEKLVAVTGSVSFADGKPAAGISVTAVGADYGFDNFNGSIESDDTGKFRLMVKPDMLYMFGIFDNQWGAPPIDGVVVRPDQPADDIDFVLQKATRVHGVVTAGPDARPTTAQRISLRQSGRSLLELPEVDLPNPENTNVSVCPMFNRGTSTAEDGTYEFFAGPGTYSLHGPSQTEPKKFTVTDQAEIVLDFAAPRLEKGPFTALVVGGDPGGGVNGAIIDGVYRHQSAGRDLRLTTDKSGKVSAERELHPVVLYAHTPDRKLAAIAEIGADDKIAFLRLETTASAKGQLVNKTTGTPLPDVKISWGRRVHIGDDNAPWRNAFGGVATTDAEGRFRLDGMVVGETYELRTYLQEEGVRGMQIISFPNVTPESTDEIDLGELKNERLDP